MESARGLFQDRAPPLALAALPVTALPQKQARSVKSWAHFVAGASAGMTVAIVTSPLDVLRTWLQSDFYRTRHAPPPAASPPSPWRRLHLGESMRLLSSIRQQEGWRGFYRGLGPSLMGVVPASAVKFYAYGNCRRLCVERLGWSPNSSAVALVSAATASTITSTVTNPIWLIKTRMQLDRTAGRRRYRSSLDCITQAFRTEGVRGLYRGVTASYLGAIETTMHLVFYEQLKLRLVDRRTVAQSDWQDSLYTSLASGSSKLIAVLTTYPHEVVRTRLRQSPESDGVRKYTGLAQCFARVWREEGTRGLYGGLAPHVLRSAPSAAIMLGVYEFVVRVLERPW